MKGQGSHSPDERQGRGRACAPWCGTSQLGRAPGEMQTPSPPLQARGSSTAARRGCGDLPRFHTRFSIPLRALRFRAGYPGKLELPRGLSEPHPSEPEEGPALPARGMAAWMAEDGQRAHLNPRTSPSIRCLHIQLPSGQTQRRDNSVPSPWLKSHPPEHSPQASRCREKGRDSCLA